MRLLKKEKEALASLLEAGAETPEVLADNFVKLLDQLRGERSHHYAAFIVAGIPATIGPFSTRTQAKKAIEKFGAQKAWVVPGWTEEGWAAHLAQVDAKPEPFKLNAKEQAARERNFWSKARPLMDSETNGLVVKDRGPAIKVIRGTWG